MHVAPDWARQAFLNPDYYLMQVTTVYGEKYWINKEQLEHHRSMGLNLIKVFRKDGRELQVRNKPGQFQVLHIGNIMGDRHDSVEL